VQSIHVIITIEHCLSLPTSRYIPNQWKPEYMRHGAVSFIEYFPNIFKYRVD